MNLSSKRSWTRSKCGLHKPNDAHQLAYRARHAHAQPCKEHASRLSCTPEARVTSDECFSTQAPDASRPFNIPITFDQERCWHSGDIPMRIGLRSSCDTAAGSRCISSAASIDLGLCPVPAVYTNRATGGTTWSAAGTDLSMCLMPAG
jgi:hypothetical protein